MELTDDLYIEENVPEYEEEDPPPEELTPPKPDPEDDPDAD